MPKYDFRCLECKQVFEVARGMNDRTPAVCPACGSVSKTRVYSTLPIHYCAEGFTRNRTPNVPSNRRQAGNLWKHQSR